MVLECYNWLLHLFNQIIIGDHVDNKKKWLRLTLSSWSTHQIRDRPRILHYFCYYGTLRISIIDGKSERECKMRGLESIIHAYFAGCCNGLALFDLVSLSCETIVVNPLSNGSMETIYAPFMGGRSCGLFFYPLAKEYRILNVRTITIERYEYHVYLFRSKTWRKIANPYFHRIPTRKIANRYFSREPEPWGIRRSRDIDIVDGNPAIAKDALHWYNDEIIMVFNIITEEFSIGHPPIKGSSWMQNLYVKDDQLCFCRVSSEEPLMDIWILEDYEKWTWVRKYVVNLNWDMNKFPMETSFVSLSCIMGDVRVISLRNNELVLFWKHRGLFSYHLKLNTVEKLHLRKSEMDGSINKCYDWTCGFEAYA